MDVDVYGIERVALEADILGTPEHVRTRQTAGKAAMDKLKAWLDGQKVATPTSSVSRGTYQFRRSSRSRALTSAFAKLAVIDVSAIWRTTSSVHPKWSAQSEYSRGSVVWRRLGSSILSEKRTPARRSASTG